MKCWIMRRQCISVEDKDVDKKETDEVSEILPNRIFEAFTIKSHKLE